MQKSYEKARFLSETGLLYGASDLTRTGDLLITSAPNGSQGLTGWDFTMQKSYEKARFLSETGLLYGASDLTRTGDLLITSARQCIWLLLVTCRKWWHCKHFSDSKLLCHPVLWGIIKPFLRKNNVKLTPSFRQVLFPKRLPVLTGLTFPTFKEGFGLVFLRFKKQQFRTFTESFKIIPYSLLLNNPLPSL